MVKSVIIHFSAFARHERRYMFDRLRESRPWVFLTPDFPRPPRFREDRNIRIADKYYKVTDSKKLEFQAPLNSL